MNLSSGIRKRFKQAFILDEDGLRRIQGTLEQAASNHAKKPVIIYRVEREDDRYFETLKIEDVLADANLRAQRIRRLTLSLRNGWEIAKVDFELQTTFSIDEDEVLFTITTDDTTWALLLADQLQPQIERTFRARAVPRWAFLLFFLPACVLAWRIPYAREYVKAPKNMLQIFAIVFLCVSTVITASILFKYPLRKILGPESCFRWGDELERYQFREDRRKNVFWGLIVAFFISFLVGWILGF
jgi:hypothetical protein